ncbi:hypothetical protein VTI28DRAFT_6852 [Corynascus sepedonium]
MSKDATITAPLVLDLDAEIRGFAGAALIQTALADSVLGFTHRDLLIPKLMGVPEWNLGWKQISDLYNDNLRYLRLEKVKKRKITEDRLRQELRFLMGSVSTLGPTAQHQARPTTKTTKIMAPALDGTKAALVFTVWTDILYKRREF